MGIPTSDASLYSALDFGHSGTIVLPPVDGSADLTDGDKSHLLGLFAGIELLLNLDRCPVYTLRGQGSVNTVNVENNVFSVIGQASVNTVKAEGDVFSVK